MQYLFLFLAFLTGLAITVQAGINAGLRQALHNPLLASLLSFGVGFMTLLAVHLSTGGGVPPLASLRALNWWKWTGGFIGAAYVTTVILAVPRIGTANLVSLSVAGQLLAAVVLDHYGLLGLTPHPANAWRLLGCALILLGVLLVVKN